MGFKRLERGLTTAFRWYGFTVGRHPLPFFMIPLILTLILAPGLFFMKYDDDVISLFTPYNAPSRKEQQVVKEFSYVQPLMAINSSRKGHQGGGVEEHSSKRAGRRYLLQRAKNKTKSDPWVFVDILYSNESNILNVETIQFIRRFVEYLYRDFTCRVEIDNADQLRGSDKIKILKYNPDFCDPNDTDGYECPKLDEQIQFFQDLINRSDFDEGANRRSKIRLTYPVMYVWNRPINWGYFLYGAEVNRSTNKLETIRVVTLKLKFQYDSNAESERQARQCMKQMSDFISSLNRNPPNDELKEGFERGLRFYVNNQWLMNDEMTLTKTKTAPCIGVTALLVTIFTTVSSYYVRHPLIGAVEAVLGVLTIGLSLTSTFALLFVSGLPFNFVVTMAPLLTLCVGIDNDFLLISAWRRPQLERLAAKDRLARAFVEAGPSLTITSVNDILCFAVGYLSESPAISDFCLFTCAALTLRYLYQLTFFSGALVILTEKGPKTIEKLKGLWRKCSPSRNSFLDVNKIDPWIDENRTEKAIVADDDHVMHRFFRDRYSSFISRPLSRLVIALVFVFYLTISFVSASKLAVNISVTKCFTDHSPLLEYYRVSEKYVLSTVIGNVVVTKPPDFRNQSNVDRFLEFVDNLERTANYSPAEPKDTTQLWLKDYLDFSSYFAEPDSNFYDYLETFLSNGEYSKYVNDLRFDLTSNGTDSTNRLRVESFQFSVYYQNARTWDDSAEILLLWRRVCRNYSDYEAVVHDYFFRNSYLDQRSTLSGTTLQTMGIASLSIALVTSLLMPDAASMFFICFSSFSVDLGVIGALNAWGSDLDPVTMACLLMTIGFSVYYTARICYCYQKADEDMSAEGKMASALGTVGWPIFQGGLATLVGIIPLVFVPAYMVRVFFRTIVLVVLIGLLHGLLFMPVLMSLYDRKNGALKAIAARRRKMKEIDKSQTKITRLFI